MLGMLRIDLQRRRRGHPECQRSLTDCEGWTYDKDVHQCTQTLVHEERLLEVVWPLHLDKISERHWQRTDVRTSEQKVKTAMLPP